MTDGRDLKLSTVFAGVDEAANRKATVQQDVHTEEHPEVDLSDVLKSKFSAGHGALIISKSHSDEAIAKVIRDAITASEGKPFTVVGAD